MLPICWWPPRDHRPGVGDHYRAVYAYGITTVVQPLCTMIPLSDKNCNINIQEDFGLQPNPRSLGNMVKFFPAALDHAECFEFG